MRSLGAHNDLRKLGQVETRGRLDQDKLILILKNYSFYVLSTRLAYKINRSTCACFVVVVVVVVVVLGLALKK
jgi:hypothetical protein